jgi:hypothetical protein
MARQSLLSCRPATCTRAPPLRHASAKIELRNTPTFPRTTRVQVLPLWTYSRTPFRTNRTSLAQQNFQRRNVINWRIQCISCSGSMRDSVCVRRGVPHLPLVGRPIRPTRGLMRANRGLLRPKNTPLPGSFFYASEIRSGNGRCFGI